MKGPSVESLVATCGDGIRQANEECDEGAAAGAATFCSQRCRVRDLLAVAPVAGDAGLILPGRSVGAGRHSLAAGDAGIAAAYVLPQANGSSIALVARDVNGLAIGAAFNLEWAGQRDAHPSVAALSGGRYAAVWTDFNGDGDERGIALRVVSPSAGTVGALAHANSTTLGAQYDADILAVGGQVVVAFTDASNPATAPDVRIRTFDASLAPVGDDRLLGATSDAEGNVALAPFAGSWAAAWRVTGTGGESIQVVAGNVAWRVGPFTLGPVDDRPAIATLDATHLLVVYSEGTDPTDAGVANTGRLRAAVLDLAAPGPATSLVVSSRAIGQSQASAVHVGARTYIAWRTDAPAGDPNGEELWLKEVVWAGGTLDLAQPEIALPRWSQDQVGDQRHPALANGNDVALVAGWDDLGKTFGAGEGNGDVVLELAPVPLVRAPGGSPIDPPCVVGRYCGSVCTDPTQDPLNCGNCGNVCDPVANGVGACLAGQCGAVCNAGFLSCNGQCVGAVDPAHCGSCANVCAVPANGAAICTAPGTCGIACNASYHACGGICASNQSVGSCGASCTPCPTPDVGTATCDGQRCGIDCGAGYHVCNGACADSASPLTCGTSCTPCPVPANGAAACSAGQCTASCNVGFALCGGACVDAQDPTKNPCIVNERNGVFVSASLGSAGGDGTRARPLASVQAAIGMAKTAGKRVYACAETYLESIALADGVSMFGGLACAGGVWTMGSGQAVLRGRSSIGATAQGIHAVTRFDSFAVVAPDATAPSGSSIGLLAVDSGGLLITNSRIHGGAGAAGSNGVAGVTLIQAGAINGAPLAGGAPQCNFPSGVYAGDAYNGGTGGVGGRGGMSVWTCGSDPDAPGACFPNDTDPNPGGSGTPGGAGQAVGGPPPVAGASGTSGANGASGGALGAFSQSSGYVASNGGTGGGNGQPGGGGGGAAGTPAPREATKLHHVYAGVGGSGGGAGGCAGVAGTAGGAGGGSFGVVAFGSAMRIEGSVIESSSGGGGGAGAFGGSGTAAGTGAASGGTGGAAGASGGGGGGPSVALARTGAAPMLVSSSLAAGAGGQGAPGMTSGTQSIAAASNGVSGGSYVF